VTAGREFAEKVPAKLPTMGTSKTWPVSSSSLTVIVTGQAWRVSPGAGMALLSRRFASAIEPWLPSHAKPNVPPPGGVGTTTICIVPGGVPLPLQLVAVVDLV